MSVRRRKSPRFHAILFCLALAGAAHGRGLDPHAYIDRAVQLIEAEQYALARAFLDPAVISHRLSAGERSRAYYLRGYSFYAGKLFASAATDYAHALEFNPDNPGALHAMAGLYHDGQGVAKDVEVALQLFHKAAELGHTGAQLYVGNAYLAGEAVSVNLDEARHWLGRAANAGFAPAMLRLAFSYRQPQADPPDSIQARYWYEQALQAGAADALVSLGYMFRNGELGDASGHVALDYFRRAAQRGSGTAMAVLGHAYMTGNGVVADYAQARAWYLRAARLQVPGSFAGLGHIHEAGLGVPADVEAAKAWLAKGAAIGDFDALLRLLYLLLRDGHRGEAADWAEQAWQESRARVLNAYAWLLATSSDARIRDGVEALRQANRAVRLQRTAAHLDTLAAAYAELRRFEDAQAVQRQALDAADDDAPLIDELHARLSAYRQARPWRE